MRTSLTSLDNRALASLQVEGPLQCIEPIVSVLDTLSPNLTIHASINESSLFAFQMIGEHINQSMNGRSSRSRSWEVLLLVQSRFSVSE